jgi:hypothetical protein
MKKNKGIILTSEGDLAINVKTDKDGLIISGLVIDDTLYQNQFMILKAHKGEFKEYPLLGVGMEDMINDDDVLFWKKRIREEFSKDGLNIEKLEIKGGLLFLEADYL